MKRIVFTLIYGVLFGFILGGVVTYYSVIKKHDGVNDEYSRGFFNCLAIVKNRNPQLREATDLPYWYENKMSYLSKVDLYNYWDSDYMNNKPCPEVNFPFSNFYFKQDTFWIKAGFTKENIVLGPNSWNSKDTMIVTGHYGKAIFIHTLDTAWGRGSFMIK